jgi:hypothetical protein
MLLRTLIVTKTSATTKKRLNLMQRDLQSYSSFLYFRQLQWMQNNPTGCEAPQSLRLFSRGKIPGR